MALSPRSASKLLKTLAQLTEQVHALTLASAAPPRPSPSHLLVNNGEDVVEYLPGGTRSPVYVVFDLETNGLGKTSDIRVCQIGAQALNSELHTLSRFNEFVNPLAAIDPSATAVTGIDASFVNNCDAWDDVGDRFNRWLESVRAEGQPIVLLAHNGKRFDARILAFEHSRHRLAFPGQLHHADTIDVFKKLYPGMSSYALGNLYKAACGKELADAHTADADVEGVCTLLRMRDGAVAAIEECRESFSSIIKRCFKG